MGDPISNPGTPPIQPTPTPESRPMTGAGEEAHPRPFTLPPEPAGKTPPGAHVEGKQSPMDVAKDREQQSQPRWTPDQMNENLKDLNKQYGDYKNRLQGPEGRTLSKDHQDALKKLTDKLTPDVRSIAEKTNVSYNQPTGNKGGVMGYVTEWLDGAQNTFSGSLSYLQSKPNMSVTDLLQIQYSMQRATQRGELFSSIIGSTVSGLETIMSTQLG